MKRIITIIAILIVSANTYAANIAISISGFSFGTPVPSTVEVGDIITWTNNDGFAHTVTSTSIPGGAGALSSGNIAASGTFQYTVTVAGTYTYHCMIHGAMNGSFTATNPATGISNGLNDLPLKLFPNPATDKVTIDLQNVSADMIQVADSKGILVKQIKISAVTENFDFSDLTEGIYSLSFYHSEKLLGIKKLVKN